jgi:hypothetical protein
MSDFNQYTGPMNWRNAIARFPVYADKSRINTRICTTDNASSCTVSCTLSQKEAA